MTNITITSKNGTDVPLVISGTQEEPTITVSDVFAIAGTTVFGNAKIQNWKNKGLEEGLFFQKPQKIYVQCAEEMPRIREAISELPHKRYWARRRLEIIDADGDLIEVSEWDFDRLLKTEAGTVIAESEMGKYLESKGITRIEIHDAVRMWADAKEASRTKANEAGAKRAQAMFDDDEADAGYGQACENAGIPHELR